MKFILIIFLFVTVNTFAADRYWVGGTASWNATVGSKWATTSGGAGGATVPTASDNAIFDAASGAAVVNISAASTCLSLTCTGFTGTISGSSTLAISASMTLAATMTLTYTGAITFNATSSQTITTGGLTLGSNVTLNGVGGTWTLQDNFNTTGNLVLTNGDLEANNKNVTCTVFSANNTNTKVITMGSGTWTCTSTGTVWAINGTGTTLNSNTSTIQITSSAATAITFTTGSVTMIYNNISITAGTETFTVSGNLALNGNFDCTGFAGTLAGTASITLGGSLTYNASMLSTISGAITFAATSSGKTVTTGAISLTNNFTFNGVSGAWTFQDNLVTTGNVTLTNGNVNFNGKNITAAIISASNSNTRTLTLGSGTITLTGTGTVWTTATTTGLTFAANTSTIKFTDASVTGKTFAGGGLTFNNFYFNNAGTGTLTLSGANTFNDFKVDGTSAHTIIFTAATTTTVTTFTVSGTAGNINTFQSSSAGSAFTLASSSNFCLQYLSVKDCTKSGAGIFRAGSLSTNVSGNTGIAFTTCGALVKASTF